MYQLNSKEEKKRFYKMVAGLVLPMALQNLINVGVSTADVVMLGKVGETALSASSLAGQVLFIMTLIFFGMSSGAAVLTAQYWGKKNIEAIEKILGMSMRIAICVAAVFTVAALFFPEPIMHIFTADEQVIAQGISYLHIVGFSYIFVAITMTYLNIMRSVERVVISTFVYSVSLVVNIVFNAILIFGMFGLPALGIQGAALATLLARIVEFVIVFIYSKKYNREVCFRIKNLFVKDAVLLKDYLTYAFPVILNELFWGAGISGVTAVIGHLGTSMVAANSVAQVVRQLSMVIVFGISNATAILIGKVIGEGKKDYAKVYGARFVKISFILSGLGALMILGISPVIRANLTLTEEARDYLRFMLYVMAYFVICQAYNTTMVVGVFRAGGDTRFGLILDVVGLWGVAILGGYLCGFVFKLPPTIVYLVLTCDEVVKLPFTTWRYFKYKWIRDVTR